MKICIIASRYKPHVGGLEVVVQELALQYIESGHQTYIITNRYPKRLPRHEILDGIPISRFFFIYPKLEYLQRRRLDLWFAGIFFFPLTLIKLGFFIFSFHPDIVNLHYLGAPSFFVRILASFLPFKLVVSLHGGDVTSEPYRSKFNYWVFRSLLQKADYVTACSSVLLEEAKQIVPNVANKITMINNGVNVSLFRSIKPYVAANPYIFSVGQLAAHKGFDILIKAFSLIANEYPLINLLIAGSGECEHNLDNLIVENKLTKRVFLLGSQKREQVASIMRGSIAVIIPSLKESFGIVALEAWAAGKPILASRVGGLAEVLKDTNICWVQPGNILELGNALRQLLEDTERYHPTNFLSEKFSWQKVASDYLNIYKKICPE